MPMRQPSRNVYYPDGEVRGEVSSIYMVFKAMRPDKITKGVQVNRQEKSLRPEA